MGTIQAIAVFLVAIPVPGQRIRELLVDHNQLPGEYHYYRPESDESGKTVGGEPWSCKVSYTSDPDRYAIVWYAGGYRSHLTCSKIVRRDGAMLEVLNSGFILEWRPFPGGYEVWELTPARAYVGRVIRKIRSYERGR